MNILRLAVAAAPLALLAACTVNPRPVVVNTPPAVVAPATVATVPAPGTVVQAPPAAVMGAPGQAIEIPAGAYPPAGQCRIWVPGLSLSQQQLPGSCTDLQNRVPVGAVLLRG
jgi:hypothetical protein